MRLVTCSVCETTRELFGDEVEAAPEPYRCPEHVIAPDGAAICYDCSKVKPLADFDGDDLCEDCLGDRIGTLEADLADAAQTLSELRQRGRR